MKTSYGRLVENIRIPPYGWGV